MWGLEPPSSLRVQVLNHWTTTIFCMIQIIINIIISNQIDSPHTQVEIKVDCTRMDEIKSIHLWMTWIKSTCQLTTQIKFTCLWVTKIKSHSLSMVKIYIFVLHRKIPKLGNFSILIIHYINNKWKKIPNKCLTIVESTTSSHLMTEPMHMSKHKHDIQHKFGTSH